MSHHLSDEVIDRALSRGEEIVNIGQISPRSARRLDRAAKRGALVKWRAPWAGFGPLKTYWAKPSERVPA